MLKLSGWFFLFAGAATVVFAAAPKVDTFSGHKVDVRGVSFTPMDDGGIVRGWASRTFGAFGPIQAHLHIDLIGGSGETLARVERGLPSRLPVRPKRMAPFSAKLTSTQLNGVDLISVQVAAGALDK